MKKNKKVSALAVICITGSVLGGMFLETYALKYTPFPDNKTLQPMPVPDTHPNISGNINATGVPEAKYTETSGAPSGNPTTLASNQPTQGNSGQTSSDANSGFLLGFISVTILIIAGILFVHNKLKK